MSKLVYYVAATMDGFIATEQHSLEWLENFPIGDDATPYDDFYQKIGAVIMGRETYNWIMVNSPDEWPYGNVPAFVMSSQKLPRPESAEIIFIQEDASALTQLAKTAAAEKNVWLVGGGKTAAYFADAGELNQLFITFIPVFIGHGIALLPIKNKLKTALTSQRVLQSGAIEFTSDIENTNHTNAPKEIP